MTEKSAEFLKHFLAEQNLGKAQFCRIVDICRHSLYKYLSGHNIHPKTARKMKERLESRFRKKIPLEKLID